MPTCVSRGVPGIYFNVVLPLAGIFMKLNSTLNYDRRQLKFGLKEICNESFRRTFCPSNLT